MHSNFQAIEKRAAETRRDFFIDLTRYIMRDLWEWSRKNNYLKLGCLGESSVSSRRDWNPSKGVLTAGKLSRLHWERGHIPTFANRDVYDRQALI